LRDDPELAVGMVNKGHGMALRGADKPASAEEVDLMIGIAAAAEVKSQMEVKQAGVGTGSHGVALLSLGLSPCVIGREAGGTANGLVLPFQLLIEEGRSIFGDRFKELEGDQTLLEGSKTAFNFSFGLRTWGNQVGNAQGGERALEL